MNKKKLTKIVIAIILLVASSGVSIASGIMDDINEVTSLFNVISVSALVKVVIMVCGVLAITWIIQAILDALKPKTKRGNTAITVVQSLIRYVAFLVILCWGFILMGVNVSTVLASVGIVALIIGFGAESLIEDVITGLFMIFENQYNVGDIVEIEGFRGTVVNIGIRTTTIEDTGSNKKIINNSAMKNILNRSTSKSVAVCDIGISYDADLKKLESELPEVLKRIADTHSEIVEAPEYLGVQKFESSSVVLRFIAYVDENNIFTAQRIMNREIYLNLKELGFHIPFNMVEIVNK